MKNALLAVISLLALSACSTVDTKPAAAPAVASQSQDIASDNDKGITGSRLPVKRTDRLVRAVGSQAYKDAKDAQPNPLKAE